MLYDNPETAIETAFLTLPSSLPIKAAIDRMAEQAVSCAIIVENKKLVGIFTERDVVRITNSNLFAETLTLGNLMTRDVITLNIAETKDIFSVSRLFSRNRVRHLPVLDEQNQVVGIVTPNSIRKLLKPEYLLRYIRISEVMSPEVIQGLPSASILSIAQQMAIYRVSCVVIVDPEGLSPIGIITERDVVRFHQLNLDFGTVPAQAVMSTPLSTMTPEDSLWNIHQRMKALKVRRLVVTQPTGELAGLVTQTQLLKMLNPTEMYHVMAQMQEIIDRQTSELQQLNRELQVANGELERLSRVDELTQSPNRRQFNESFAHEWKRLTRLGRPLSLILCDVDYFKSYNDSYGHLAGDQCLVTIAQALRETTRGEPDLVARYGGEEFVVVLPDTTNAEAEQVAQTILTRIQGLNIPHRSSSLMGSITVSLGVATVMPSPTRLPEMLLQVADQLLYMSKQNGRNTYTIGVLDDYPSDS